MKHEVLIWFVPAVLLLACWASGHAHRSVDAERYHYSFADEVALEDALEDGVALEDALENGVALEERIDEEGENKKVHTIEMPGVQPEKMDTYLCIAYKLPIGDKYIVKYEASEANMNIAHHMLLFGCEEPFHREKKKTWKCREMQPVCSDGKQTIMYAWAKGAKALQMPEDVGFHVGGDSGYKYLVLQVHYLHVELLLNRKDRSGVKFTLDQQKKRYLAGIYLLADGMAPILPHRNKTHIDMGCFYPKSSENRGPVFKPFRFRVHAHKLGTVITGYRVRNDKWRLIGRGDPQKPQAFNKAANDMLVRPGDTLMGRCTYDSTSRNRTTLIGATHSDEMCNFYIMYHYDSEEYHIDHEMYCGHPDTHFFKEYPVDSDVSVAEMEKKGNQ